MSVPALFIHILLCACSGWFVLSRLFPKMDSGWGVFFLAGLCLEFMAVFSLCNLGLSFAWAGWGVLAAMSLLCFFALRDFPWTLPKGVASWLALFLAVMAVVLALVFSMQVPLIYDDALTVWAGRAKALYFGVNWSFVPLSEQFLGRGIGVSSYPLGMVMFTAMTGLISGGFDDVVARSGSLAGYMALFSIVWNCGTRSHKSGWCPLALVVALWALPFLFWQAVSGYADLMTGCFAAGALCSLVSGNFILAGALGAGAGLIKNEGLMLFLPALCAGCLVYAIGSEQVWKRRFERLADFFTGAVMILPWLAYYSQVAVHAADLECNSMNLWTYWVALGFVLVFWGFVWWWRKKGVATNVTLAVLAVAGVAATAFYALMAGDIAGRMGLGLRPLAFGALWDVFITGPVHQAFWIFMLLSLGLSFFRLKDLISRTATVYALVLFILFVVVFCFTGAYEYLVSQTTVHRIGAQMYGTCLVCVSCWMGGGDFFIAKGAAGMKKGPTFVEPQSKKYC